MSSLSEAKTLGGIGSILVLFTAVPTVGWILGIAGFVLTLVAVNSLSQVFNDKRIYYSMRNAFLLAIGAIVVGTVTIAWSVYRVFGMGSFVGSKFVLASNITTGDWIGLAASIVLGVLAVEGFMVASAVYVRRTFNSVAAKSNVKMFETAGLLYFIGAATAIIAVGFVLIFVAEIILAVSFFSIPEQRAPEIVAATS